MRRRKFSQANIKNNIKLIRKIAWSFHCSTGVDYSDLVSEGYLAFLNSIEKWDKTKGAITTFTWYCVHSRLTNFINKYHAINHCELHDYNAVSNVSYLFENLTNDALEIANLIVKSKKKFQGLTQDRALQRIKNVLLYRGWEQDRIDEALKEMKTVYGH